MPKTLMVDPGREVRLFLLGFPRHNEGMAVAFEEIFRQAADLSRKERELLTDLLLSTLAAPIDPEIERSWHEELDRRAQELEDGSVKGVPWEEASARLRARLHAKKRRTSSRS